MKLKKPIWSHTALQFSRQLSKSQLDKNLMRTTDDLFKKRTQVLGACNYRQPSTEPTTVWDLSGEYIPDGRFYLQRSAGTFCNHIDTLARL